MTKFFRVGRGLAHSYHKTRKQAEKEIAKRKRRLFDQAKQLRQQANEYEEYANSLEIDEIDNE